MNRKDLFQKAHQLTREDMRLYSNINYRVQFGLNLSALYEMNMSEKMVELKGSEKQIKWANDIREKIINKLETRLQSEDRDLRMAGLKREDIETTIKNIKKIDSAKVFIDSRYDSNYEFINKYKDIIVKYEYITKCQNDERLMRRIAKHKAGSDKIIIDATFSLIRDKIDEYEESGRLTKMVYDKLMEEA